MRISDWIADVCSSDLTSLSGLDTVILTYDGQRAQRTLPDPLTARVVADEFDASFGYSKMLGDWTFSATADGGYIDTNTRVDRRRNTSALVDAAAAGALAIDGALPFVPGAGMGTARDRDRKSVVWGKRGCVRVESGGA